MMKIENFQHAKNRRFLSMKLKYLFVLLTILLVIGCATETPEVTEEETIEETTEVVEETETVEEEIIEEEVTVEGEQVILIKGPKAIEPSELTVSVGTIVVWKNEDYLDKDAGTGRAHTLAEWSGYFRSERLEPGDVFSFTFNEPGTYEYRSITTPGARGTIIVE